jgi:hypothetical protein
MQSGRQLERGTLPISVAHLKVHGTELVCPVHINETDSNLHSVAELKIP